MSLYHAGKYSNISPKVIFATQYTHMHPLTHAHTQFLTTGEAITDTVFIPRQPSIIHIVARI